MYYKTEYLFHFKATLSKFEKNKTFRIATRKP